MFKKFYKTIIVALLTIFLVNPLVSLADKQAGFFVVSFKYNTVTKELSLEKIYVLQGELPADKPLSPDGYKVQIISTSGTVLYSGYFPIPELVNSAPRDFFDQEGNQVEFKDKNPGKNSANLPEIIKIFVKVPYSSEVKTLEVYDPSGMAIMAIDVSAYSLCENDLGNCETILLNYYEKILNVLQGVLLSSDYKNKQEIEKQIKSVEDAITLLRSTRNDKRIAEISLIPSFVKYTGPVLSVIYFGSIFYLLFIVGRKVYRAGRILAKKIKEKIIKD